MGGIAVHPRPQTLEAPADQGVHFSKKACEESKDPVSSHPCPHISEASCESGSQSRERRRQPTGRGTVKVGGHLSPPWCLSPCPRVDLTSKAWWLKASGVLGVAWVGQGQPGRRIEAERYFCGAYLEG